MIHRHFASARRWSVTRKIRLLSALAALASSCAGASLDWTTNGASRWAACSLNPTSGLPAGFSTITPERSGLTFTNRVSPERSMTNQILLNGSGVAAGDVDGDGRVDIFLAGLGGRSALWRNLGDWHFENVTGAAGIELAHLDATGCAFADLDGDGDLDLVVNSLGGGTAILMNDGRGHFQFNASAPFVNRRMGGTSLAVADLDGDGLLDLYIANYRTTTVRDQAPLQFTLRAENGRQSVASINGRPLTDPEWRDRFQFAYRPLTDGGVTVLHDELGEPDALFRNLGQGRFVPIPWTNGSFLDAEGVALAGPPRDWGLSVIIRDLNGDGAPDIYVCNDFASPDRLWLGDGRGRFRAAPRNALRHTSFSSMGVDVADVNRDGHADIFVVDMLSREHWRRLVQRNEPNPSMALFVDVAACAQAPHNTLQLGRADGTFGEVAQMAGIDASEWSWTPVFLDVDLDGWEDLLVANGFERDNMNIDANRRIAAEQQRLGRGASLREHLQARANYPRLDTPNAAFRNLRGARFADMSDAWHFNSPGVSQGLCLADLDGDGDLDVVVNNFNGPAGLLRNDTTAPRVAVRLRGIPPNTQGIGARIVVQVAGLPEQSQEMICGGRYLSCDAAMRTFAAGMGTAPITVEVSWRNGTRTVLSNAVANRVYEIFESGGERATNAPRAIVLPQFTEVPLGHSHAQTAPDDFILQPALPAQLSTGGPGVSWIDIDNDGREDLVIAGGRGSALAVFRNGAMTGFKQLHNASFDLPAPRNESSVLPWFNASGFLTLLAGAVDIFDNRDAGGPVIAYPTAPRDNSKWFPPTYNLFPTTASATGPLAMADVNGDGSLDLFIGGRCISGRWPEPSSSRLFLQQSDGWRLDTNNSDSLAGIGLVNGAVFSDIDGDGEADLIVSCEWGSLRFFRNRGGKLEAWDPALTFLATADGAEDGRSLPAAHLNGLRGIWTGVTTGDFDGDGRQDIVAGNWGRNTRFKRYSARPVQLLYGDLSGDGSMFAMEAAYDEASKAQVPLLGLEKLARHLPWLQERFPTAESLARASIAEVLVKNPRRMTMARLEANWFDSTVFLNRGDHFEVRSLPIHAQHAPVFGVCVADFDGDGTDDLFLAQNFFGVRPEHSRLDAGRGLLLRGDGHGRFQAVDGGVTGLKIYGEQRGAAVCDFDGDGRVDLVVGQNNGATRLFRNATAQPGLRVHLRGDTGNPQGIGAVLRVEFIDGHLGAARELHGGSGWCSCDSAIAVLGLPMPARSLHVRWPGGRETITVIPQGASTLNIRSDGRLVDPLARKDQ